MNLLNLSFSYIKQNKLSAFLNLLLLSLGIGTIIILLLFSHQFEKNLYKNAEGIDAVVGAKGSPIQLILSSVYHMDTPTGNISLNEAKGVLDMPAVAGAIPLALGDSYYGFRIVGTTRGYPDHYGAKLLKGDYWKANYEVVIGSQVAKAENLNIGDPIISSHGVRSGGHQHEEQPLTVVGIMQENNTVLDRLILTGVPSVWAVHHHEEEGHGQEQHHAEEDQHDHDEDGYEVSHSNAEEQSTATSASYFHFMTPENMDRELTAMLISYRSPVAAISFPRTINAETDMQAAAPAFEMVRLLSLLGIGLDAVRVFGFVLILTAGLGVFITLYNALKERKYDLAIMRTMGGSRLTLMKMLMLEGLVLAIGGALIGIALGHITITVLGEAFYQARQFDLTGWIWLSSEFWLLLAAIGIGIVSSLIPAIQAYQTDISSTLAQYKT